MGEKLMLAAATAGAVVIVVGGMIAWAIWPDELDSILVLGFLAAAPFLEVHRRWRARRRR